MKTLPLPHTQQDTHRHYENITCIAYAGGNYGETITLLLTLVEIQITPMSPDV